MCVRTFVCVCVCVCVCGGGGGGGGGGGSIMTAGIHTEEGCGIQPRISKVNVVMITVCFETRVYSCPPPPNPYLSISILLRWNIAANSRPYQPLVTIRYTDAVFVTG